ncbi:hypothetical protein LOAG_01092 [Loa loa]|uniref:Uncharacterized protein n=1 Tax=Loa loa TaxID=7209 RepID=A0A1S0UBU3_LOALO|nr:hypothetical protein LOAG_01092 [Loa loa]EFO27381.1 hypothetical protein LOAG_01092 [Loa loa]
MAFTSKYYADGSLFNLKQLKAHSKTLNYHVRGLLFADNTALIRAVHISNSAAFNILLCKIAEFFGWIKVEENRTIWVASFLLTPRSTKRLTDCKGMQSFRKTP